MIDCFTENGLETVNLRSIVSFSNYALLTTQERDLFELAYVFASEGLRVASNFGDFKWRFFQRLFCNLTAGGIGAIYTGVATAIGRPIAGLAVGLVTSAVISSVACK